MHRWTALLATVWLEAIPDAVLIVDAPAPIVLANHRAKSCSAGRPWGAARAADRGASYPGATRATNGCARASWPPAARPMGTGRELAARHRDGSEIAVDIALTPLASTASTAAACATSRPRRASPSSSA